MEQIPLPKNVDIELDQDNPHQGTVTIEPLYPGYGPTLANSLRRVLLSSLPGAAIFAFKVKGVKHEFSTLPYVKEDLVDISLNLKRVNLKCFSESPVKLELTAKGEKVIKAGDISPSSDIEIANPDQTILTLTDAKAAVEMTLWVTRGRGYEPVEARSPKEELEINAIALDAIYTPVRQVGYQVDNVRVGGRTDYDKINMQIETNGIISIAEAVGAAAKILAEQFDFIANQASDNLGSVATEDTKDFVHESDN